MISRNRLQILIGDHIRCSSFCSVVYHAIASKRSSLPSFKDAIHVVNLLQPRFIVIVNKLKDPHEYISPILYTVKRENRIRSKRGIIASYGSRFHFERTLGHTRKK